MAVRKEKPAHPKSLTPMREPADGSFALTSGKDGTVAKWDLVVDRKIGASESYDRSVSAVAVTPNGCFCVSGGMDETVHLKAAETGEPLAILRGHIGGIYGIAITPDARRFHPFPRTEPFASGTSPPPSSPAPTARKSASAARRKAAEGCPINVRDEGVDGEIEFVEKRATALTFRVQLKSGDSHLRKLKNGTEKFAMKKHYAEYWAGRGTVPVLLIVRSRDGTLRYMNATAAIHAEQNRTRKKAVTQLIFIGEPFTKEAVMKLRKERLAGAA